MGIHTGPVVLNSESESHVLKMCHIFPQRVVTCHTESYGVIRITLGFHGNHDLISFAHLPSEVAGVIGQKLPRPCSQLWETSLGEDLKRCFAAT